MLGKHTDAFLDELVMSTDRKTEARLWYIDDWGGYERILPHEGTYLIGKVNTQCLERTNGIVRQQTGRCTDVRIILANSRSRHKSPLG